MISLQCQRLRRSNTHQSFFCLVLIVSWVGQRCRGIRGEGSLRHIITTVLVSSLKSLWPEIKGSPMIWLKKTVCCCLKELYTMIRTQQQKHTVHHHQPFWQLYLTEVYTYSKITSSVVYNCAVGAGSSQRERDKEFLDLLDCSFRRPVLLPSFRGGQVEGLGLAF